MAKLTAAARKRIPKSKFALPGGRYPVEDRNHAVAAKARASQQLAAGHLSIFEKNKVDAAANKVLKRKR